jgi:VIT1/CCC1 family predicted Fe2+/Mn2+ transporter
MRFAIDLVWLGSGGRVLRVDQAVRPWRVRSCRGAVEVLELAAGQAREMIPAMAAQQTSPEEARGRMRAGFDPRQRLYRDPFNEYFVFVLSAAGASVIVPVALYIVMAITGLWAVGIFVLASVALELILIFGIGRPQMKPMERVGWALLWGFSAAVLALCFYYLVADSTL